MKSEIQWWIDRQAYVVTIVDYYRNISNIRGTKSQNLNVSRLGLQLFLCNIFKPKVKWRMKM